MNSIEAMETAMEKTATMATTTTVKIVMNYSISTEIKLSNNEIDKENECSAVRCLFVHSSVLLSLVLRFYHASLVRIVIKANCIAFSAQSFTMQSTFCALFRSISAIFFLYRPLSWLFDCIGRNSFECSSSTK